MSSIPDTKAGFSISYIKVLTPYLFITSHDTGEAYVLARRNQTGTSESQDP